MRGIISEGPALPALAEPTTDDVTVAIERIIAEFPARTRAVAELRLRHQRSTVEIAAEMGTAPAVVERHIRRVTAALQRELPARLR